jgi:glycosyltransferase involved in cell wall biosynthesis
LAENKKITFIIPETSTVPTGGHKIVYGYAMWLQRYGYNVNIVSYARLGKNIFLKNILRYLFYKPFYKKKIVFFANEIDIKWVFTPNKHNIKDGDFVFASSCDSAFIVNDLPKSKGEKFFLIQADDKNLTEALKLPLKKIAVSSWLASLAKPFGNVDAIIPNAIDKNEYFTDTPPEKRNHLSILLLHNALPAKGTLDGIKVAMELKEEFPDLEVNAFGVCSGKNLPKWVRYYKCLSFKKLRELYNASAIYISTSYSEGCGLIIMEAMNCSCAVIATDIPGHSDFLDSKNVALRYETKNVEELKSRINFLLKNPQERIRIAKNGNASIQKFSWEENVQKLIQLLES